MEITRENFGLMLNLNEKFEERVTEVLNQMCMIRTGREYEGDTITKIEYGMKTIEIETTIYSHCSCCSDDTEYYEIPTEYLFNDNWKVELEEKVKKEYELREKEKEEKEKQQKELKEKQEREEYERLKEKYSEK